MRGKRCCGWPSPRNELSTGWKRRGCCPSPPELADFPTLLGLSTDLHALFQQTRENPRSDASEPGRNAPANAPNSASAAMLLSHRPCHSPSDGAIRAPAAGSLRYRRIRGAPFDSVREPKGSRQLTVSK